MKTRTTLLAAGILLALAANGFAQATFTKITTGAMVTDQGQFIRGAWGDFNNDGFLDLIVCNWGGRTNVFYRNNGNGTFTKITIGDPVQDADYHVQANVGDYDNDGFLDLFVASGQSAPTPHRSMLYHNNGDGTFSRTSGGGITNELGYFSGSAWADYDNDGFLDLFIGNQGAGLTNRLWHSNGDGTFTRITAGPPVSDTGGGAAIWADYDNDGFMDLLVINPLEGNHNRLYLNKRDGTFTAVVTNVVTADQWLGGTGGATWGDYDNDAFQDLFVTGKGDSPNRLYHNNGDGTFSLIASVPMASRPAGTDGLGCAWGDYDNDGYLDLFVTSYGVPNALYHNNGNGTFTPILAGAPVNEGGGEFSLCGWVDYDNDGFLDLFVTRNNTDVSSVSNLLYHNDGNTNGWLEVKLVGTASNRSAIGAKVRVQATIRGNVVWQMREISNGGGRCDQPLVAHFGLGDATNVDLLRIQWPSGIVQTLTNVAPRQILTVVEHQQSGAGSAPQFTSVSHSAGGAADLAVTGGPGLLYAFEASTDLVRWTKVGVKSNATGIVSFTDTKATNYAARFYRVSVP